MWSRLILVALLIGLAPSAARAPLDREPTMAAVRLFHGPSEGLETVDADLIGRARRSIDMAAYVLTDRSVMEGLEQAAARGVRVRLYLDPDQASRRGSRLDPRLDALLRTRGIEARFKSAARDSMHLKAYHVDGRWLRTGSANFSFSGANRQDNDLVVIESREATGAFASQFERLWARADNDVFHP